MESYFHLLTQKRYSLNTQKAYIGYFLDFRDYFLLNNIARINKAEITSLIRSASIHTPGHRFATHLYEHGIDLRYDQELFGQTFQKQPSSIR